MKNTTHRVVILNNVNSALISQAILILRDGSTCCDSTVLEEAERVVEKYMKNSGVSAAVPRRKNRRFFLMFSACALIAGTCALLARLL